MKKTYEKPEVFFENFSLCTNIAAGCELKTNLQSSNMHGCGYVFGRGEPMVFTLDIGCETTAGDGVYNGICYHIPTEANNLFNS